VLSGKDSRTIGKSIEETRRYHKRYLRAISSPLRREILRALKEGYTTIEDLQSRTELDNDTLNWHLSVLEQGFCIEKNIEEGKLVYKLTQEGEVVDYME
jgi:DNA-binding transcriptional ArsR family regulator